MTLFSKLFYKNFAFARRQTDFQENAFASVTINYRKYCLPPLRYYRTRNTQILFHYLVNLKFSASDNNSSLDKLPKISIIYLPSDNTKLLVSKSSTKIALKIIDLHFLHLFSDRSSISMISVFLQTLS